MTSPQVGTFPVNPVLRSIRHTRQFVAISGGLSLLGFVGLCATWDSLNNAWLIVWGFVCASGSVLVFVGLATLTTYRTLFTRVDSMFSGNQLIGRWSCTPQEWARHMSREAVLLKQSVKSLRWLALLMVPGLGMMIFAALGGKRMAISSWLTMFGIGVAPFIIFYFFFVPFPIWFKLRLLRTASDHDVYVGPGGVIIGGIFLSWEIYGARLQLIRHEAGDPGLILFRWGQPVEAVYEMTQEVRAPVPQSHDADATHVVEVFRKMFKGLR